MLLAIESEPSPQMIDRAFAADRQAPQKSLQLPEVPACPKVVGGLGATQSALIVCGHMPSYTELDGVQLPCAMRGGQSRMRIWGPLYVRFSPSRFCRGGRCANFGSDPERFLSQQL